MFHGTGFFEIIPYLLCMNDKNVCTSFLDFENKEYSYEDNIDILERKILHSFY